MPEGPSEYLYVYVCVCVCNNMYSIIILLLYTYSRTRVCVYLCRIIINRSYPTKEISERVARKVHTAHS